MKNLLILAFFIMALVVVQFAQAQTTTVDDVVDKYITALGGKEKLLALKTLKSEGTMSTQGYDISITNTRTHLTGLRMDIDFNGTTNYQVLNTTKGSSFWPVRGQSDPEDMDAEQYKYLSVQLDLQGPLVNYKEKGNTVELVGKETVDKAETYHLKLTFKNAVVTNLYIDAASGRLVKTSAKISMGGQEVESVTTYADYKQNADGYWFAYTVTTAQGTISYDKISTNIPVDESIYKN